MDKMDGKSLDLVGVNREALVAALSGVCPEVVSEGNVDLEKLSVLLGKDDDSADRLERYNFTWAGKKSAIKLGLQPSTGTLRPAERESVNWDTTQNLYIEGDNLEVLKLLQKSYFGKVKMIYIDPPYNTGKEFVYSDDYADNIQNYLELTEQINSSGRRITTNTETSGRYHTNWLNMMYPRLKLARNLLRDDGVIFISIDDNEVSNLRKICDEIFGEENFVINICHKSRASVSNDKIISPNHNHIIFYAKSLETLFHNRKNIGLPPDLTGFNKKDERGFYKLVPVDGPGGAKKGNPHYTFLGVTGYWRFSQKVMQEKYDNGLIVKTANNLQQKYYQIDAQNTKKTITSWWDEKYYTSEATKYLNQLLGENIFDTPKPVSLIKTMLMLVTEEDDIILDFFSGSGTTAHAVMQLNAEDGGNRKFIMVQLPEPCDKNSEAFKAGYKNICEIGKERIRRATKKIVTEQAEKSNSNQGELDLNGNGGTFRKESLDLGFKVFKLDTSNFIAWDSNPDNFKEENLSAYLTNIKMDRSQQDLIYELFIKLGVTLNTPFEKVKLGDKYMYDIGYGTIYACLDSDLDMEFCNALIKYHDEKFPKEEADSKKEERELERYRLETTTFIFQDASFANDNVKTNIIQTLCQHGLENIKAI